ncbi:DNA primase [Arsenophonus endosymbiont of Lipoptena cervi]|uniref:DNA primase n=1 Tax=Arsenophonus endosymbiont of Lipoptena cervi TaxID=363258 RepID=UPI00376EC2EC
MSERIPHIFINDLLARTNIVDLVGTKVTLKKQGKNYYAYCPFHNEKTPSFTINEDKQFYYCFGCGAQGNAIDFLIHYEKLNFIETIEELASRQGLDIPYKIVNSSNKIKWYQRNNFYQLMNDINQFYQKSLSELNSDNAKKYLIKRGLNDEIIRQFSIGFAPKGWSNLLTYFNNNTDNHKQLNAIGMLIINNNGKTYDYFRNRIMFPIKDKSGRVIAFGGRALDNIMPKYLNSPETEIFHKGRELYGLYEAIQSNRLLTKLLVVEGYMDVISLAQFGINYAVASLGTVTTVYHIQLLFRTTDRVICCYDGDNAGRLAAWRTLKIALPYLKDGRQLEFIFLPDGEDPDSLIRKEGKKNFEQRIIKSYSLSKFLFDKLIKEVNLGNYEGKAKFNSLAIPLIKQVPSVTLQLFLIKELGKFIGIPDISYLFSILEKRYNKKTNYKKPKFIKPTTIRILIALLLQNPSFVNFVPPLDGIKHSQLPGIMLFLELVKLCKSQQNITTGQLLEYYRNNIYIKQLKALVIWNDIDIPEIAKRIFKDSLKHLFIIVLNERFEYLMAKERTEGLTSVERKEVYLITASKIQ